MANTAMGDLEVTGTLTVNGVEIGVASSAGELAGLSIGALVGAGTTDDFVIAEVSDGSSLRLKVQAQASPNLTVKVGKGTCIVSGGHTGIAAELASLSGFAAPSANPRIDIVQISTSGVITRKAGTESASPSPPAVDSGNLLLATVYNRVGQTSIKDTDDASNGYITDARVYYE